LPKNILDTLETFRTKHRLSKTAMGKLLGVSPQMYNNWYLRGVVPTAHQSTIQDLLDNPGKVASADEQILAGLSELSASDKQIITDLIAKLSRNK